MIGTHFILFNNFFLQRFLHLKTKALRCIHLETRWTNRIHIWWQPLTVRSSLSIT